MKSDSDIKRDLEAELKWDPDIDATDIAVAVKDGVATLTGFVRGYMHKWQAERDAKRVSGVSGVANDIVVRLPGGSERPDPEIARDAVAALKNELPYSSENMKVVVKDGWITLEGSAEWNYQRTRAENAVRRVRGTKGVINLITKQTRKPGKSGTDDVDPAWHQMKACRRMIHNSRERGRWIAGRGCDQPRATRRSRMRR